MIDGDASTYLEELVVSDVPALARTGGGEAVELVGPHIRLAATVDIGHFGRLSDFINNHEGLLALRDVTVLRRNGEPTRVIAPTMWVNPAEVTLIAQPSISEAPLGSDLRRLKTVLPLIVVAPGHTLTGEIYLMPDAELALFIESPHPPFLPMTDVRTRSLADRRVIARYPFALLNRRHIVAATQLQPGMAPPGRTVL